MMQPLEGLVVLDFTRLLPGPVCTWHLASMGARVIKIEDKAEGDYARQFFQTQKERDDGLPSVFFRALNANKELLRLDLKNQQDKAELMTWIDKADLVIESFRPGVMHRLGFGAEQLLAIKPSLVYCAITGYGLTGSWKLRACHDINSLALSGVLDQMRAPDGRPVVPNIQFADVLGGGVNAAMGSLAALWQSQRTGKGAIVDVSMTDGLLAHNLTAQVSVHNNAQTKSPLQDLLNGGVACYSLYETKDKQWLALGALELKFWQLFCHTLGKEAWMDKHWSLGHGIGTHEAMVLQEEVQASLNKENMAYWLSIFEEVDCCLTPVLTLKDAMSHELFLARGMFHQDENAMSWLQSPLRFSAA